MIRIAAAVASIGFYLWMWWRSLPVEMHHIMCIVALWFALAVLFAMRLTP